MAIGAPLDLEGCLRSFQQLQARALDAAVLVSARHDVTPVHLRALLTLAAREALPALQLSKAVGVSVSGSTPLIDRLTHHGHAQRSVSSLDRRVTLISLTPAGRAVVKDVHDRYAAVLKRAVGTDYEAVSAVLDSIEGALRQEVATW